MLPVPIAAQGVDEGQGVGADDEIGMIGCRAKQIERHGCIRFDQPGDHLHGGLNGSARRSGIGFAEGRFDERRRRSGNLCSARKKEAQARLLQPCLSVFLGQDRL